jgi:hypothetical protein
MSDSGFERFVSGAGNLYFLAAIALFVTLILLTTGMARAQEYTITDSLDPDALEEDALGEDALGEDALGLERVDPALIRQLAVQKTDLPIAEIPPRPPQAIPMYFCWRCWAWHPGFRGGGSVATAGACPRCDPGPRPCADRLWRQRPAAELPDPDGGQPPSRPP